MTLKRKTVGVFGIALIISIIAIACGGPTTENIIATQQALNRIENTQIAATKTVAAGGEVTEDGRITTGEGSIASIQATRTSATSTALAGATPTPTPTQVVIEVPEGPTLTDADNPTVQIGENVFTPALIKVVVGTTVTWENPRRSASSTKSLEGQAEVWDSGAMSKGTFATGPASFSHTFTIPGCHQYGSFYSGETSRGAVCVVE